MCQYVLQEDVSVLLGEYSSSPKSSSSSCFALLEKVIDMLPTSVAIPDVLHAFSSSSSSHWLLLLQLPRLLLDSNPWP